MTALLDSIIGLGVAHAAVPAANNQVFTIQNGTPTTVEGLANQLLSLLTGLAYPIAFICLVYTAYLLITAGGKADAWTTAKKNILNLTIGIFLIVFAAIMVRFVTHLFR
jgi:hypothetical protein